MITERKWALNSAKKLYYIFIICSWSYPSRQLFHTFSSLLKHYLPLYLHFQLMTTIFPPLKKVTIMRHLPELPLSPSPPLFFTLSLVTGQLSMFPLATSHLYSAPHSLMPGQGQGSSLSLKALIFPLHGIISISIQTYKYFSQLKTLPTHFFLQSPPNFFANLTKGFGVLVAIPSISCPLHLCWISPNAQSPPAFHLSCSFRSHQSLSFCEMYWWGVST